MPSCLVRFARFVPGLVLAGLLAAPLPGTAGPLPGQEVPTLLDHMEGEGGTADTADTASAKAAPTDWVVAEAHGPADTVRFATDQGTWMNVDVSPDGKTLVFDLLGDLYLLPRAGGAATRLTSGPAYDMQPRFSPDGRRILFTTDRDGTDNVWVMDGDGANARPVTEEKGKVMNSGAWSPDGDYVVARKRLTDASSIGTVELWLYNVHGGSGIQVTKKDAIPDANEPVFSPDGRWIYFAARGARYQYNRNVYDGIWQIQAFDRTTGQVRPLTDGYGGSARPEPSPDGRALSFIRRDRDRTILVLHDLETGRERVLFTGLDPDMQENFAWTGCYPAYAWTRDGKEIVIGYGGGLHAVSAATGEARDIPFTCEVEQHVTKALHFPRNIAPEEIRVRMIAWPSFSPDGNTLLFSALGRLYRMAVPGGVPEPMPVNAPRAYCPVYSPDGRHMAHVTWSDAEGGHLWVRSASGGDPRRLTEAPGQIANPVFSPDGERVAFLKGSGATERGRELGDELWFDLCWVPVKGGKPNYVISVGNRGSSRRMPRLAWSADGTRIYYNEDEGGGPDATTVLASVLPDGTDRQVHLKIKHAEEIVPSPDGKWVAWVRVHEGFVAPLPHLRREPLDMDGESGALPGWKFAGDGADWLMWSADSRSVSWGQGPRVVRVAVEDVIGAWEDAKAEKAEKTLPAASRPAKDETDKKDEKDEVKVPADTLQVDLRVPRDRPHGVYALTGARLITMKGDEVVAKGTIVVRDDRIEAVGADGSVTIPPGAKVFPMDGKTIIPGLIDVHAHLHYNALDLIPESLNAYYANLAYGVTTTHDPSASTYAVFTQSEMVEAGVTAGPRIFSTGFILYGADIPNKAPIESLEDAQRHVRRLKNLGAFSVKSYMQPRRDQRQWVIEAARAESMLVVPEGGGNLEVNLSMVLDGHTGIEHALPVAPLYKDVVTLLSRSGTGYTPTLLVAYGGLFGENWFYQHYEVWQDEKLLRFLPRGAIDARSRRRPIMTTDDDWHHMKVAEGCRKVVEAGGRVQLGAHGQLQGLGAQWELWALTQGGMSNHDALRCATLYGAQYLGLDGWIGSLEAGKLADFVVLDADPLLDIHNSNTVHRVIKNGEMWEGDTMNRVWPSEKPCPAFYWQAQGEMLAAPGSR